MSYKTPGNPNKLHQSRFREFAGIGGPALQILKRTNSRGWDLSNTVQNDVRDADLQEDGTLYSRPGFRKFDSDGYSSTVRTIIHIGLSGWHSYGVIHNGILDAISIPFSGPSFDFTPLAAATAVSTQRIAVFPGDPA